jgi:hypothetical protein
VGLADGSQLVTDDLPADSWDIPVQGVVTPAESYELSSEKFYAPKLDWEELSLKTVKKIDPLWKLSCDALKDRRARGQN